MSEEYVELLEQKVINIFLKKLFDCHVQNIIDFKKVASNSVSIPIPDFVTFL
jgi:hypothetical protein